MPAHMSSYLCRSHGAVQKTADNAASPICHTTTSDWVIIFFVFSSHCSKLMEKPFCSWPKQTLLKLWALSWALLSKSSIPSWCSKLQKRTLTMNFEDGEFGIPSAFCFKSSCFIQSTRTVITPTREVSKTQKSDAIWLFIFLKRQYIRILMKVLRLLTKYCLTAVILWFCSLS